MQACGTLERLAEIPPGALLAAALDSLELACVPNGQIVDVLTARYRQLAHDQAQLLATLVELGRSTPDVGPDVALRAAHIQPWASGEIAAALTLTHRAADRELHFAETVLGLPLVFAALRAGRIDRGKAWVFADHLHPLACGLTAPQIDAICSRLVPLASGWTTGQLAARLMRAIISVDPEHARRRYDRAVRERQVCGYLDHTGTVTITATGLPTDEAAVACERLERLAGAVKRAGHTGRLAHIQADLFLGLLDGRFHHQTEAQIIASLLTGSRDEADDSSDDAANAARDEASSAVGSGGETANGVEIRVGLSTLLGFDEKPGEIPGLGPVLAPVARKVVAAQVRGAQWRFAVTDPEGYLDLAGVIRRRPSRGPRADDGLSRARAVGGCGNGGHRNGGVVEIHLPASLLHQLAAGAPDRGAWAGVITDIAAQYSRRDTLQAVIDRHSTSRFVRGALARHIEVRDRTCSHPGCRRPARKSDLDHTQDHCRGGLTTSANAGPGCRMHHFWKSELGWRLRQPQPGHFEWTSPLGRTYRTRGDPISPPTIHPPDDPPPF
ncbi:MAG TPA: DUF222 domain-containing protein [Pseudonocardia sp.]|nr:DUF222 domain-containing protein [Pseudonocardia sp.]